MELYRITKKGGVVVWVVADSTLKGTETGTSFKQALYFMETGFNLHDTMVYKKANFPPLTHFRYEQSFEYMFVLSKGKPKTFNPILVDCIHAGKVIKRSRSEYDKNHAKRFNSDANPKPTAKKKQKENVWEYKVGGAKTVNHVAQFPEKLANDHIISWSNPNDIILDPMCGSGTTLKMAKLNNRNFIGIDVAEEYCEISRQRVI